MECPYCGGPITRDIREGQGANSTASRNVGGRNMEVARRCRDCDRQLDASDFDGYED